MTSLYDIVSFSEWSWVSSVWMRRNAAGCSETESLWEVGESSTLRPFYTLIPDNKIQQSHTRTHTQTRGTWCTDEVQMTNTEAHTYGTCWQLVTSVQSAFHVTNVSLFLEKIEEMIKETLGPNPW